MAQLLILPKLGQSVESCIISEVRKNKGDSVKKGEILYVYETDKASFEEESPADGVILEMLFKEGDEVPVLSNMMVIGAPGEDYASLLGSPAKQGEERFEDTVGTSVSAEVKPEVEDLKEKVSDEPSGKATVARGEADKIFISPRAKHLAEKEAVDTWDVSGTGPKGRIVEKDVKAATGGQKKTPLAKKMIQAEGLHVTQEGSGLAGTVRSGDLQAPENIIYGVDYEDKKLSNMRKLIAKSMHASLQNSAQLTHHLGADARRILKLRKKVKKAIEEGSVKTDITLNDLICFAVVKTLKQYSNVNSHFLGDSMRLFNKVHLGLAVDTDRGLMVPVVRNADDLSIEGLANQFKGIAAACRKGNISPDLLSPEAASFTVSNLGNYGVEMFTPVINLPQSAILGVNTIIPRPKDMGDGVYGFVPYLGLSLTYDHRALDGGEATRFLKQVATEIENLELDIF